MIPDYSPAMLRGFLTARIVMAEHLAANSEVARRNARRAEKVMIRNAAQVSDAILTLALQGRLMNGTLRARIWGAIGIVPAVLGVTLTDDGGQVPPDGSAP